MVLFDKIKAHLYVWISILTVMSVVGCARDNSVESANVPLRFTVRAKALNGTSSVGASLSSVRLVAVRKTTGGIAFNRSTDNGLQEVLQSDGSSTFTLELKAGDYALYSIANETASMSNELNNLKNLEDIKKIAVTGSFTENTIPYLGQVDFMLRNVAGGANTEFEVSIDGGTTWSRQLDVTMTRTQCKVSLFLRKKTGTNDVVKIRKVELCKIPDKSYLVTKMYDPAQPVTRNVFEHTGLSIGADVSAAQDDLTSYTTIFDTGEIFPEKNMTDKSDASKATYLRIVAEYGTAQTTYLVKLRNDIYIEDYNLTRNVHYNVYGTITSEGEMGIYAMIVPTKIYDIAVNWKPVEGLVIVSDREADLNADRNVWNDYSVYTGLLKVYNKATYNDVLFKYGSVIAITNNTSLTSALPFVPPVSANELNDVIWYPSGFNISGITGWSNVPYLDDNTDFTAGNAIEKIYEGKGDPCRLAGLSPQQIGTDRIADNGQWHMATPAEYALLMKAANGAGSANDLGYRSFHELLLPNVKYRDANGLLKDSHSGAGTYWVASGTKAFSFVSQNPAAANVVNADPSQAYAVRCVRNSIPKADISFGATPGFSYKGSTTGNEWKVYSNVPYWKFELITSGTGVGSATEFDDFSFVPPGDPQYPLHVMEGAYSAAPKVYVKRKESTTDRTFGVKFSSIHYNGEELEHLLTVTQQKYTIRAEMTPTPSFDNDENRIPLLGGTYNMHILLTPDDITMPAVGSIKIELYYHGILKSTSTVAALTGSREYDVELVIPKNETPDIIGLDFSCKIKTETDISFREIGNFRNYQLP